MNILSQKRVIGNIFRNHLCFFSRLNIPENEPDDSYDKYEQSAIYCKGRLLHDVQMSRLYRDSKTFVDKKMKFPVREILKKFNQLKSDYHNSLPPKNVMQRFVDNNFTEGNEFEAWTPPDWKPQPAILHRIQDKRYQKLVLHINEMWRKLARKVKEDVKVNPHLYSLLYLPNGFIIPGGRFRELYYWDTYWIVSGLLLSDMQQTAKGIIENMLFMVEKIGFIPNGTRLYYIKRSQPPLLASIVDLYVRYTGDIDFIKNNIQILEKELKFWTEHRSIDLQVFGNKYTMYRYFAASRGPRPESYWEDLHTVSHKMMSIEKKADVLIGIKSAAESGWDFSSRWFINEKSIVQENRGVLSDTSTHYILPVDLNSIMQKNFRLLSCWFDLLGDKNKATIYNEEAEKLLTAIETVLWRMGSGVWCDFDIKQMKSREFFYASNFFPLWTESHSFNKRELSMNILKYLAKMKIEIYEGSLTTSIENSRQQWDFPNVWPPLVAILSEGLYNLGTPEAMDYSKYVANTFLSSAYLAYTEFGHIYEKYFALERGLMGDFGEYEVEKGFGWTNGAILEILNRWSDITAPGEGDES